MNAVRKLGSHRKVLLAVSPEVVQKTGQLGHQFVHALAAMVACDVSMQITPQPLNGVMLRAVRGQEVQLHFPLLGSDGLLGNWAGMNDVVVDNQVEELIRLELFPKLIHQQEEESGTLAGSADPEEVLAPAEDSPGDIALLLLSGGEDFFLSARQHPVGADFRIQVDVDFVLKQGDLIGRQRFDQLANVSQAALSFPGRPRATYYGSRATLACLEPFQHATHGRDTDFDAALFGQH
jgi:hypothetical protein